MSGRAIVFAGAGIRDYSFCKEYIKPEDTVICCDSGLTHAKALGLLPNYIVGDFDSVSPALLAEYENTDIPFEKHPAQKDETDMELGLDLAVKLGIDDIIIIGGIGSRFDHTLANAHLLLRLLKKGVRGRLVDEKNCVELIDQPMKVHGRPGDLVSTIPLSMEVTGITLKGFQYPLTDKTLTIDDDIVAVSNVLLEEEGEIRLTSGYLFVILARD